MFTITPRYAKMLIKTLVELEALLELVMQYNTSTVDCNTTPEAVLSWAVNVSAQITVLQTFLAAQIGTPVTGQNYNTLIISLAKWNNEIIQVKL